MKSSSVSYLHFTKKERNGIFMLLGMVAVFAIVFFFYPFVVKRTGPLASVYQKAIVELETSLPDSNNFFIKENEWSFYANKGSPRITYPTENLSAILFYFDPNEIGIDKWQQLGVKQKTATGIRHYIEKGGKFRNAEDIRKIWGISATLKERLIPFIKIENAATKPERNNDRVPFFVKEKKAISPVDINESDTAAWIALPGIGSKLANRIVTFREKLGGFYEVKQISETFGLPDSTFEKILPFLRVSGSGVKKININTASLEILKQHPYFRGQVASAIIAYREQHGPFRLAEDLKKVILIKEDVLKKILPYCEFE